MVALLARIQNQSFIFWQYTNIFIKKDFGL